MTEKMTFEQLQEKVYRVERYNRKLEERETDNE